MRTISGQRRCLSDSTLTAKPSRGGGWSRSWRAIGVAVVLLALPACGGGGGGDGGQEPGEVVLGQPGPGDAGNHFPFSVGNVWRYQGTRVETGLPPETFVNTLTITGTRQVGDVTVTVFEDSNPDNLGAPEETFLVKDLNGIADFGNSDPTDTFTPLLIPFWEARFPLETGASFVQLSRAGLSLGEDLDEDGINDRVDLRGVVKMSGFEAVTVPAGTFAACAKFEQNIELIIILSRDNSRVTSTGVLTLWFAPNVGLVKRVEVTTIPTFAFAETVTEELIGFAVDGQTSQITLQANPPTVTILSGGQTQLSASAFNPTGAPVAVIPVTWTSSNPAVASVDANGQVLGFAFGSATITASLGDIVSNPVTVTVSP